MATANPTINHASPAQQLYNEIATLFGTHSNWTLIESLTISTNTYYVWKNHGTGVADNNSYGSDFYVIFTHATAAGNTSLLMRACEDWNATSDLMIRPCMDDASNPVNADASGLAAGGVAASTTTGVNVATATLQAAPNNNECFIVVTKNFVSFAYRRQDNAQASFYAGIYETRVTIANEFPLCLGASSNSLVSTTSSGATFSTSRHPFRENAAAASNNFGWSTVAFTTVRGDTANVDPLRGKAMGSRLALSNVGGTTISNVIVYGGIKGLLYDVVHLPAASGVTLTVGDTLDDIGGDDYWYFGLGAVVSWINKAAV